MLKIDINLATKRYKKTIIPYIVITGALFLAVIYTWHNIDLYRLNQSQISRYRQQLVRFEKTIGPKGASVPAITQEGFKLLIDEVDYINNVIARETFSWTELLTSLEANVPPRVSIVQITPEFEDKRIRVAGLAKSVNDILTFVDKLGRSKNFMDVFLLKHATGVVKKGKAGKRLVSFNISAEYVSGAVP
jgi:hypothetical protein